MSKGKSKTRRPKAEKKEKRAKVSGPAVSGGSDDARKTAAVVLEVLGGVLTPSRAAEALGITCNRYYQIEVKALRGLVRGCERASRGPSASPERQIRKLEKKVDRLQNECGRYRALARAAQTAMGLSLAEGDKPSGDGKRKRRPQARALRAASVLKSSSEAGAGT